MKKIHIIKIWNTEFNSLLKGKIKFKVNDIKDAIITPNIK